MLNYSLDKLVQRKFEGPEIYQEAVVLGNCCRDISWGFELSSLYKVQDRRNSILAANLIR